MGAMQQFVNACQLYLFGLSLGDLRSYGRTIGVSRPTAKKKEDLIADIIGILTGTMQPIPVSKQGAPVKNDRVDDRIPAKIAQLVNMFFSSGAKASEKQVTTREPRCEFGVESPSSKANVSKEIVYGQVDCVDEAYYLLPVDFSEDEEKIVIPQNLVNQKKLRAGDILSCRIRVKTTRSVAEILTINGVSASLLPPRPRFDECMAYSSSQRLRFLGGEHNAVALKFIEWLLPMTKGQRGCVISAPKAGKTQLILQIASAVTELNENLRVYTLLVDQSPETVSEFQRELGRERLFYTTYDDEPERQTRVANLLLHRLKRKAEMGEDVLLLVDSLSALARAYNATEESSGGKTLSCGLEMKTLHYLKKYFGAARCLDKGGSITILGAIASDTGNPFDDVVCAELASLASYEIRLNDQMATRRIFPALDLTSVSVKRSELVRSEREEEIDYLLRNEGLPAIEAEGLLQLLTQSDDYLAFSERVENLSSQK